MKIIHQSDVPSRVKPEGELVSYFMFDEYEVIQVDQPPHTKQQLHHHTKTSETVYVIEGELVFIWLEKGKEMRQLVKAGDLIETGAESHTFANESDKLARIICIKRIPTGENNREVFKTDKVID